VKAASASTGRCFGRVRSNAARVARCATQSAPLLQRPVKINGAVAVSARRQPGLLVAVLLRLHQPEMTFGHRQRGRRAALRPSSRMPTARSSFSSKRTMPLVCRAIKHDAGDAHTRIVPASPSHHAAAVCDCPTHRGEQYRQAKVGHEVFPLSVRP